MPMHAEDWGTTDCAQTHGAYKESERVVVGETTVAAQNEQLICATVVQKYSGGFSTL